MINVKWRGDCPNCGASIVIVPVEGSIEQVHEGPLLWCITCETVGAMKNPFREEVEV